MRDRRVQALKREVAWLKLEIASLERSNKALRDGCNEAYRGWWKANEDYCELVAKSYPIFPLGTDWQGD